MSGSRASLESVLAWLTAVPGPVTVGMEATIYWEWLATHGHTVRVAHARTTPDPE